MYWQNSKFGTIFHHNPGTYPFYDYQYFPNMQLTNQSFNINQVGIGNNNLNSGFYSIPINNPELSEK
jgi:hypothetical protein